MRIYRYVVAAFCFLWIAKEIAVPLTAAAFFSNSYMEDVARCDLAMNSSWFIGQTGIEELEKSELVQMMDCHEYDKTRKIMLISGLPENYLSFLGLKSLEINQRTAQEFVQQHRFTER